MDPLQAIALGAVQGITEWLPISSSGHLALLHFFLGLGASPAFDVSLHAGTLLAVLIIFREDFYRMAVSAVRNERESEGWKNLKYVAIATVPGALAGYLLNDFFESLFGSLAAIGVALCLTGALLYAASRMSGRGKLGMREAVIIGLAQAAAVAPGISRSGSTIAAGMLSGVEKNRATHFSLLLSVPITLGAAVYEMHKASLMELEALPVLLGIVAAFVSGYLSIKVLVAAVKNSRIQYFSYYCLILGASVVAYSLL